jgi:cell division protein FtsB
MLLRPRQILAPIIFATVFGYFGYHLVNGDRGLLAMVHLQREVLVAEQNFTEAETTRKIWERRVAALRNQSLDPDMLDERARVLLASTRAAELLAQGRHRHLHADALEARLHARDAFDQSMTR